ncbi:MAG: IclR family transcriptional regulator [Rhodobacteraceae bacterium]|nr:IclR family transcriptional regulator [Paracoccaceae bacterium]
MMARVQSGDGTVGKAVSVLDQIAALGRPVRFSELLDDSDMPKATLYRLVQTLTNQGLLAYDPDRQTYAPGLRLVQLAHAAWEQSSIAPVARPFVDKLARKVGQTVHLAQLDHGHVLYVDKRDPAQPIAMFSQAGRVGPAYCTGVGKAMLAFLPEDELERVLQMQSFHRFTEHTLGTPEELKAELAAIRARGYAFDREEHEPRIICIAMPILTRSGRVLGAMSVTTSTAHNTLDGLTAYAPDLKHTAQEIAETVESWRFPEQTRTKQVMGAA